MATFSAIRAANVVARVAQQSLLAGRWPVLMASRRDDPAQKVNFYLAVWLRNAGSGIAVLHGGRFYPDWHRDTEHTPAEEFERQNRDLYIPPGGIGFWQGAFRGPERPQYAPARKAVEARGPWTVELLYGDHEGRAGTGIWTGRIHGVRDSPWRGCVFSITIRSRCLV